MKKSYEFPQIVTRQGDTGRSSNYDGEYYSKDDILFDTLGNIDELSSWIGKIKHLTETRMFCEVVQTTLQYGGSLVATNPRFNTNSEPTNTNYISLKKIKQEDVDFLEAKIKSLLETKVTIKNGFVLPGGSLVSADVDIARSVCRRTERSVVRYMIQQNGERYDLKHLSMYLNRLSDLLFTIARFVEQKKGAYL